MCLLLVSQIEFFLMDFGEGEEGEVSLSRFGKGVVLFLELICSLVSSSGPTKKVFPLPYFSFLFFPFLLSFPQPIPLIHLGQSSL